MSKIDDLNDEMKELNNKLDHALDAIANGTMEISEGNKIYREVGKRISQIGNEYAKLIKNKNSKES